MRIKTLKREMNEPEAGDGRVRSAHAQEPWNFEPFVKCLQHFSFRQYIKVNRNPRLSEHPTDCFSDDARLQEISTSNRLRNIMISEFKNIAFRWVPIKTKTRATQPKAELNSYSIFASQQKLLQDYLRYITATSSAILERHSRHLRNTKDECRLTVQRERGLDEISVHQIAKWTKFPRIAIALLYTGSLWKTRQLWGRSDKNHCMLNSGSFEIPSDMIIHLWCS